jgi:Fe-S-cluster containining protein
MYDFYDDHVSSKDYKRARNQVDAIYAEVPDTEGCMENIHSGAKCGAWCCEFQNPSLYYVEFLATWNTVANSWPKSEIAELVASSIRQHFDDAPTKGCIFWDKSKKTCRQHTTRPMACRLYAQEPEDEFKPKYERLKILYENNPKAVIRDQCNLVTSKGTPPTKDQIDQWDKQIKLAEQDIGINPSLMHDGTGGSYRTYKDHIILKIGSPGFLSQLTELKARGDKNAQEHFIQAVIGEFEVK